MYTINVYEEADYAELDKMSITQIIDTLEDYQRAFHSSYRGAYGDEAHYQEAKYDRAFEKAYNALYCMNDLQRAKTDKEKISIINKFFTKGERTKFHG